MIFYDDLPNDIHCNFHRVEPLPCVCGHKRMGLLRCFCDEKVDGVYTYRELSDAFDWISPSPHWKGPIRNWVSPCDRAVTAAAITWFTGSVAKFTKENDGLLRVEADGYYRTIGA